MKIIETHPREKGFVLWGHCQNILDDPRTFQKANNKDADLCLYCLHTIGIAPITQLRTCVIKIVTFKGCHLMW